MPPAADDRGASPANPSEGPALAAEGPPPLPSLTTRAVWLLIAKTVGFALAILLPVMLVRRMSQEQFGLYKQVFFIVNTAMYVLPLGFGMSAYYYLPRERDRQGSVVVNIVLFHAAMGLLIAAVLMLVPGVLTRIFNNAALEPYAGRVGLLMMLWTIGSFLEVVTVAAQDVRATTGFIVASQLSKTAMLVIAAVTLGTVEALITAGLVQGAVQIAMLLGYLHHRFPGFWRAFDGRLLRTQAAYAVPLGLAALVLKLQDDLHHYFVSYAFGPAAYAVYAVGVFKLPLIGILRESVGSVMLPRINELEHENDQRRILLLVATAARKLALAYYPLYVFLMVTGPDVISVLFTTRYLASWPILAVSLTIIPFNVIVLDPVTRAQGERYFILRVRAALFALLTLTLWFGARSLGLVGIISAVVAANLLGWLIAVIRMARLLGFSRRDVRLFADVARIAGAALFAGLVAAWIRFELAGHAPWLIVVVCATVFGGAYAAAIVHTGVMQPAELKKMCMEAARVWRARRRTTTLTERPGTLPRVQGREA